MGPPLRARWSILVAEPVQSLDTAPLRALIVDDEPLAVERMQVICARIDTISVLSLIHI